MKLTKEFKSMVNPRVIDIGKNEIIIIENYILD